MDNCDFMMKRGQSGCRWKGDDKRHNRWGWLQHFWMMLQAKGTSTDMTSVKSTDQKFTLSTTLVCMLLDTDTYAETQCHQYTTFQPLIQKVVQTLLEAHVKKHFVIFPARQYSTCKNCTDFSYFSHLVSAPHAESKCNAWQSVWTASQARLLVKHLLSLNHANTELTEERCDKLKAIWILADT